MFAFNIPFCVGVGVGAGLLTFICVSIIDRKFNKINDNLKNIHRSLGDINSRRYT
jgi:hypothetical protein